jgi:hypothetical protein
MSRQRLTNKVAGEELYTMNDARKPEEQRGGNGSGAAFQKAYDKGGPSEFGEDPITEAETKALHDKDVKDRTEMNVGELRLAFANAIKNSQNVREHAAKCVTASECMLPGCTEEIIAANAADLMFLPEFAIDGILSRQASLAEGVLASAEGEEDGEKKPNPFAPAKEKKATEAAPQSPVAPAAITEEKPAVAAIDDKTAMEAKMNDMHQAMQAMAAQIEALKNPGVMAAAAPEAPAAPAEGGEGELDIDLGGGEGDLDTDDKATPKTASVKGGDALESIFAAYDSAPAAMPSNMVRKASARSEDDELSALWGSTPDVSSVFR